MRSIQSNDCTVLTCKHVNKHVSRFVNELVFRLAVGTGYLHSPLSSLNETRSTLGEKKSMSKVTMLDMGEENRAVENLSKRN